MSLRTTTDPNKFNESYGSNNPVQPMSVEELEKLRKRLFDNISDLNGNKYRIKPDEYNQLSNYHHYALTILDNMKVVRQSEMSDPYYRNRILTTQPSSRLDVINPYETQLDVVYKRNGQATIVNRRNKADKYQAEWEKQFDTNIMNPPCYSIPPSNLWGLPQSNL